MLSVIGNDHQLNHDYTVFRYNSPYYIIWKSYFNKNVSCFWKYWPTWLLYILFKYIFTNNTCYMSNILRKPITIRHKA